MLKNDLGLRLDEDFLYILNFLKNSLDAFQEEDKAEERKLGTMWLEKLCGEMHTTVTAKRLRNNYLTRLVSCYQMGKLLEPFLDMPPKDHLAPMQLMEKPEADPTWLNELLEAAKEVMIGGTQTKDCQTYISSKVFDQNKGACAYIAVAVADEGEIPKWIRVGEDLDDYAQHMDNIFSRMNMSEKEPDKLKPEHSSQGLAVHQELIEAIDKELANITVPYTFEPLENMLKLYMDYVQGTPIAKQALEFTGDKFRNFFLTHLRSELVVDLNDK